MSDLQPIYHIAPAAEVERAARSGKYAPSSFATEGFIHCCYGSQVNALANRMFHGQANLLLLEIDPARLRAPVIAERSSEGDEPFPHIHGELPMAAVLAIRELRCSPDGGFDMPCIVKG
jgi:uncharacterized protein (DUF952 family)